MFKLHDKIDLSNKFVFLTIVLIVVFTLTYINNYGFYNYVKIRDYQEIRTLAKTIHFKFDNCLDEQICVKETKNLLENLNLYIDVRIFNEKNNTFLKYSNIKPRHIEREKIKLPNYLINLKNNYKLEITKNSFPNIFDTTVKSVTFSIYDIFQKINSVGVKDTVNWYFEQKIYLRSQHVIFFFLFGWIVLTLFKIKQSQLLQQIRTKEFQIVNYIRSMEKSKKTEEELYETINILKSKEINLKDKLEQYESIINPPISLLNFDDIINLDPESIIFKCRKVTEKLITVLYIKNVGNSDFKSLDVMIKELKNKKILNKKALSYANTIKAFGNISAHPDIENPFEFTQEDAMIISNGLILLIEELNINGGKN